MFELILKDKTTLKVTCCGDCPRNKTLTNPLAGWLPPTHYCSDTFDLVNIGRTIYNPNGIPGWCPHFYH
jgi:hypothetical protein